MADRGRPIPYSTVRLIQRLRQALSLRKTAREANVSTTTVQKYTRKG